jgi:UDP:flavonoid glycosyltransferase YjiC (YdhE family)
MYSLPTTSSSPKHIVFATTGSLGDLVPFLLVGNALQQQGHKVSIATTRKHRANVQAAGLAFHHMRPDPWDTPDFSARFMDRRKGAEFVFKDYLCPAIEDSYEDLKSATDAADLLVSQSLALAAPLVAGTTGIPWISAVFQPFTLFSAHDPPALPVPLLNRPARLAQHYNLYMLEQMKAYTSRWTRPYDTLRKKLGLPGPHYPIYEGQHSPRRVLAMFSPVFGKPQPDWPAETVQTGAIDTRLPHESSSFSEELQYFLEHGEAPLIFTLGASSGEHAGDFYQQSIRAAEALGKRALFITGNDEQAEQLRKQLPRSGFAIGYMPYEEIFSHGLAIIHAGGMGATVTAMKAGKPQLFAPYAHDQHDNARRAARHGLGRILPRHKYKDHRIVKNLRRLLQSPVIEQKVSTVAGQVRQEDGVNNTCTHIQKVLHATL